MSKKERNVAQFYQAVEDLLCEQDILEMKNIKQHSEGVSCYEHSLFVAYISYLVCKKLKLDWRAAARGALLHDLHLSSGKQSGMRFWKWLRHHPALALQNAEKFSLSRLEENIITSHMWPLSLTKLPRHRESLVVNAADSFCALLELMHIYKKTKTCRRLREIHLFPQPTLTGI